MTERPSTVTADDLYREIGEALSSFEEIEFHLSGLFSIAMGSSSTVGNSVWRAVNSFDTRLKMLLAACNSAALTTGLGESSERTAALSAAKQASDIRAYFAHGVVMFEGGLQNPTFYPSASMKMSSWEKFEGQALDLSGLKIKRQNFELHAKKLRDYVLPIFQAHTERLKEQVQTQ